MSAAHDGNRLLERAAGSLTPGGDSLWRLLIGIAVIVLTFLMAVNGARIPVEWESIFLLVIGYYFKDRPIESGRTRRLMTAGAEGRAAPDSEAENHRILGEMTYQFLLAVLLIAGAALCFFFPNPNKEISTVWSGGVMLAIAFYFKDDPGALFKSDRQIFRRILVLEVLAITIPMVLVFIRTWKKDYPIAIQWAAVVLIVAGFYFKESAAS